MRDLVASIAVGKIDGKMVLDIAGKEDTEGEADMPIAMIPTTGEVTLMQLDGLVTKQEIKEGIELAKKGIAQIYEAQKKALKERYSNE
jgi:exosome complex component RRP41